MLFEKDAQVSHWSCQDSRKAPFSHLKHENPEPQTCRKQSGSGLRDVLNSSDMKSCQR